MLFGSQSREIVGHGDSDQRDFLTVALYLLDLAIEVGGSRLVSSAVALT